MVLLWLAPLLDPGIREAEITFKKKRGGKKVRWAVLPRAFIFNSSAENIIYCLTCENNTPSLTQLLQTPAHLEPQTERKNEIILEEREEFGFLGAALHPWAARSALGLLLHYVTPIYGIKA